MRKRRIDAKTRVAVRAYLGAEVGAVETCQFLSPQLYWDSELLNHEDKLFVQEVAGHPSRTFLRDEWHPDFVEAKLESLEAYESEIQQRMREVCERILVMMQQRRLEADSNEDS